MKFRVLGIRLTVLTLLATFSVSADDNRKDLAAVVASERAFAKRCGEVGIKKSFLEYFTRDAVNFIPGPTNAHELYGRQPDPPSPPPVSLEWGPVFADVSSGGDLGYTTGPSVFSDKSGKRPPSHGYYFSLWKKQSDGTFKVVLDVGTQTPAPGPNEKAPELAFGRKVAAKPKTTDVGKIGEAVTDAEKKLSAARTAGDFAAAYLAAAGEDVRVHRNGSFPFVGRKAVEEFLATQSAAPRWTTMKTFAADSGDLAYSYGSYEDTAGAKGFYIHVWKLHGTSDWKLVADITQPAK